MMVTQSSLSNVIFFHCDCGCDRTGQLAGSYMMRKWKELKLFCRDQFVIPVERKKKSKAKVTLY